MKSIPSLFFLLLFALLTLPAQGQHLKKGNLLGLHVLTIELKPGATMQQVIDYYNNTYFPSLTKNAKGIKGYLVKGRRGEDVNRLAVLWVFPTEAARNRYFKEDGSTTALGDQLLEKLAAVNPGLEKLATVTGAYTDWVIQ